MWIFSRMIEWLCPYGDTIREYVITIGLETALLILLCTFFVELFVREREGQQARARQFVESRLSDSYARRRREEQEQWERFGENDRKQPMYRMDRLIDYSGFRERIHFLSAEFLVILGVLALSAGVLTGIVTGLGVTIGTLIGIALNVAVYIVLRLAADRNYNEIEGGLFAFVNAVSIESKSSDDLITILDASIHSLCPPLQVRVSRCCVEARNTGKLGESLRHLELSVENKEFCKVIRNLSMCYRTDADYTKVLEECRRGLKEHIASREERKAIVANYRFEMVELIAIGILTLYLIGNIIGEANVFAYLYQFTIGRIVLIYIIAATLWCVVDVILARGR